MHNFLRKTGATLILLSAQLGLAAAAHAEQPQLVVSGLHLVAGNPAIVGEVRTVMPGEVLFGTTLVQPDIALLEGVYNEPINGLRAGLIPSETLRRTRVIEPGFYQLSAESRVYCGEERQLSSDERRAAPVTNEPAPRNSRQRPETVFASNVRVCLIDDDEDGVFERGFIHGGRTATTQTAVAIAPVRYLRLENQPIADRFVRFEYGGIGSLTGSVILLTTDLASPGYGMQTLTLQYENDGSYEVVQGRRGIGARRYPKPIEFGSVLISVLAVDPVTKQMTYRVERTFAYQQVLLQITVRGGMGATSSSFW